MSRKTRRPPGKPVGGNAASPRLAQNQSGRDWLSGLLLVLVTVFAYQAIWQAGFIWNDDTFLTENPLIKRADGLLRFWLRSETPDYFPLTSSTLWLEWRLWGANATGYHLTNLFLHCASAVLLWRVLARLKIPGAWLAAAIFALHPVNVESVAWITERKNTLAMLFYVWTLLWYLKFEDTGRRRWYWLALGMFGLSLLSKTAGVMLPVVLLGVAWWRRGRVERRDVWRSLPYFAVAAVMGLVTVWFQSHRAISTEVVRTDDLWSRAAVAGGAVWFYLSKVVLPLKLAFVYPRWPLGAAGTTSGVMAFMPGLLVVGGLLVCWIYRRTWGKAWLCGMGYFVLLLLPILGFVDIYFMRYSLVADHWQYFAIIGPIALVAAGVTKGLETYAARESWLKPVVCGGLLAVLGVLTWREAGLYQNPETLWRDTLKKNPGCWMAEDNLGNILIREGQTDEAMLHYHRALELNADDADTHYNLGVALAHQQQLGAAIGELEQAVKLDATHVKAQNNLGIALAMTGRTDEAIGHFNRALELEPDFVTTRLNLAIALSRQNRVDEAIDQVLQFLKARPDDADALKLLGSLKAKKQGTQQP